MMNSKNLLLTLAAILVVGLAIMAYVTYNMPRVESDVQTATLMKQSKSDDTDSIEKDLDNTELDDMDQELTDIDKELNSSGD